MTQASKTTDAEMITEAVRYALQWDIFEEITPTVSDGWVTLDGAVERWSERDEAERATRNLAGVKGVLNRIRVRPTKRVTEECPLGRAAGYHRVSRIWSQ